MHEDIKKLLCMEDCHPGNAVSVDHGDFKALGTASTATNAWTRYSAHVLGKDSISFLYTPLNQFPFYQDVNYVYGENGGFNVLPIQAMGKMQIRCFFREDTATIFNIAKPGNKNSYRFVLNKMTLLLKELKLSPQAARAMMSYKGSYLYRGLTKSGLCENPLPGAYTLRTSFNQVDCPEGFVAFCVNKKVVSGVAKFQDLSLDGGFLPHNVKSVDVHFNGQHFYNKLPNFGTLDNFQIQREKFGKMVARGPFGILMDPKKLTFNRQGISKDWAYPCVWVDLTETGPHTRLQTLHTDSMGYHTNKMGDLSILFNFEHPDGAADAMYIIVIYYTDFHIILDMKTKRFYPVYNKNKVIN